VFNISQDDIYRATLKNSGDRRTTGFERAKTYDAAAKFYQRTST